FFIPSVSNPDLPSFPTRRSSDLHDNGFVTYGDYRIGHDEPGDRVSHASGNPATNLLTDWLTLIRDWSLEHPQHAPITLGLDVKRSEEHTSELQSRSELVCRLLLE